MKAEFLRNLAGLFEACTVYTAAGLTCGGAAALATIACGGGATMAGAAGAAGFFLPAAPLYWYFTSDRAMEATFRRLDKWKQQKYINEKQAKELKEAWRSTGIVAACSAALFHPKITAPPTRRSLRQRIRRLPEHNHFMIRTAGGPRGSILDHGVENAPADRQVSFFYNCPCQQAVSN